MVDTSRTTARAAIGRRALAVAAICAAVGCATACGGSGDPPYCADRAALERSLEGLRDVDLSTEGLDALTDQLTAVQRDATALVDSARDEFGPEASALRSAIARLERSARVAIADPSAEHASTAAADASGVAASFGELSDAIGSRC